MARQEKVRADPRPLYARAEEAFELLLAQARAGERLPAEPDLARQMGISRATLREAMRAFAQKGRIVRRQGVGTFVVANRAVLDDGLEVLDSLPTIAGRMVLTLVMGDHRLEERGATPSEARHLGREPGSSVLVASRTMLVDGSPVAFLVDVVPAAHLSRRDFRSFSGSVLDLLVGRGDPELAYSRTRVTAELSAGEIRRQLKLREPHALLKLEAELFSLEDEVVDYSVSHFVPEFFHFHINRRVNAIPAAAWGRIAHRLEG
jgi:GntR family transcriptional regulator